MTQTVPVLDLQDFLYELPENRIAKYPLALRDQSKLMVWQEGKITHKRFHQLTDILPLNSILFFNNTKVIPARVRFRKDTGAIVEVFLLNPTDQLMAEAMAAKSKSTWQCAVGNMKRWDADTVLRKQCGRFELSARWHNREQELVTLSWTPDDTPFATVLNEVGAVPLPPYIKREAEPSDRDRYQTVYSQFEGAVAAPTAGLHFTQQVIDALHARGIPCDYLTLHVSAGTFLPIKETNAAAHRMHEEQIILRKNNIVNLLQQSKKVIAVGTTALRTLESAYWYGALLTQDKNAPFSISQNLPYSFAGRLPTTCGALEMVLAKMNQLGVEELTGHTGIYLVPGYRFRITQGLITNFHQPGSTLLLLIAALIGPAWKSIYKEALTADYRFLSYGDSSLLLPGNDLIP